jgi:hypothetical protein
MSRIVTFSCEDVNGKTTDGKALILDSSSPIVTAYNAVMLPALQKMAEAFKTKGDTLKAAGVNLDDVLDAIKRIAEDCRSGDILPASYQRKAFIARNGLVMPKKGKVASAGLAI